ncbi:MAG: SPFH domain-containing protein, partial [Chloroflexota bacterium]|nr:SPFH domain-containing protein [Chloroflexota bacterium]
IQEAMNRQMSAERIRRADVTEAEGKRQAEIAIAEGDKQAEILRAEGHRQAEILTAEGDQQAAVLRADGFSTALDKIHQVASNVDTNTISLQYFETLKEMGKGSATKFVFPMEFTNLLGPFASMLSAKNSGDDGEENN